MRDDYQDALVFADQRCRCQVEHARKVRASEPLDRKCGQLVHAPFVSVVASPELVDVEVCLDCRRVYVQALREVFLALLRIILRLQRVVHQLLRADCHAIREVCLLLLLCARVVHVALVALIRPGDQDEEAVVPHCPVDHLDRVFHVPVAEAVRVVAGRRDPDDVLVSVCLLRVLEQRVLLRFLISGDLVGDREVAVETVLRVRVRCQGDDLDKAVRSVVLVPELISDRVIEGVVQYPHVRIVLQSSVFHVEFEKAERFERLLQRVRHDVDLRAAPPLQDPDCKRKSRDEARLAALSGCHDQAFLEAPLVRAGVIPAEDVHDHEDLPALQH